MLSFPEVNELADDVRRVFEELERRLERRGCRPVSSLYSPPLDVLQTDQSIDIVVDLPGVRREDVRVVFKHGSVIIAGEKLAPEAAEAQPTIAFHLVERGFGRFARVIRLPAAVDAASARATFAEGELRVSVPTIADRRGREIAIPIEEHRGGPREPARPDA